MKLGGLIVPASANESVVLAEIHADSFPEPWTAADFETFLYQPGISGWMTGLEYADGFILIRRALEEAEVLTLAVRPNCRQRGLARALLNHAMEALRTRGTASCYLEVAVDNIAALGLYRSAGFNNCATRRGYYARGNGVHVDATVMRRDL